MKVFVIAGIILVGLMDCYYSVKGGDTVSQVPKIVNTEWLAERLDDPKLRILDATLFLEPNKKGPYRLSSGKEAYEKEHIQGAVFADILNELSDPDAKYPMTVPPRDRFVNKMSELGVGDGTT
ncbi:hypothetical protein DCC39_17800 [Pueribacillus theae]|uniref:Rhodanese domain-containing protein n=1 Tax=Pueribacillus theae TaxID=2171751 RepID=A0A2U1JLM6_9BACI|nr:hypothetical protein [Pueribacillus theae]PWA05783.1 hypothetical protein DCC39_17800 [Pueribacillus theae]